METINIDIQEFTNRFDTNYEFLYENRDCVEGYSAAVEYGDAFMAAHREFVGEFVRYRGDAVTSDREVAAFAFALDDMGLA